MGNELTMSGIISSPGSNGNMTKLGAGTLIFAGGGANTATGTLIVGEGSLNLAKTAALPRPTPVRSRSAISPTKQP